MGAVDTRSVSASAHAEPHVDGLRALYEQAPASLGGNVIGIVLIGMAFWPLAAPAQVLGWLGVAVALWLLRLAHYLRYRAARDSDTATLLGWRRSWRALVLLQGMPNKMIAREMHLSVDTIKDHVAAVLRALGVSSRTQAVLAVSQMTQMAQRAGASGAPAWKRSQH